MQPRRFHLYLLHVHWALDPDISDFNVLESIQYIKANRPVNPDHNTFTPSSYPSREQRLQSTKQTTYFFHSQPSSKMPKTPTKSKAAPPPEETPKYSRKVGMNVWKCVFPMESGVCNHASPGKQHLKLHQSTMHGVVEKIERGGNMGYQHAVTKEVFICELEDCKYFKTRGRKFYGHDEKSKNKHLIVYHSPWKDDWPHNYDKFEAENKRLV